MPSDGRKYPFRLIAAKGLQNKFILLNSLLHSALIREYLQKQNISYQPEVIINNSKLDFLIANKIFVEVK
jgi:DNA-binding sugar fermentation-stimulating protein